MTKHFDENDAIGMLTKLQYLEGRKGGRGARVEMVHAVSRFYESKPTT
jgi:hypothetical protein